MSFKPEGFSEKIFKDRYAFTEDESWEEACRRVGRQASLAESRDKVSKYEEKFSEILYDNLFCPGGRIWYGSGRLEPNLLNCFVLSAELDSKYGWGNLCNENVVTSMSGGGCGQDFSDIRPFEAEIRGHRGLAPGPLGLMIGINDLSRMVRSAGGRRAANMFSLNLTHPDILKFLDSKLQKGELELANISVRSEITSKFIELIRSNSDLELSWKGRYRSQTNARDLWNKIVYNSYECAEPGFLNWELVESENTIYYLTKLITTNPCFVGDTKILTEDGYRKIEDLSQEEKPILINSDGEAVKGIVWSNGFKETVKIKRTQGDDIFCTPDHEFMDIDGNRVQAKDLKGKRIMPFIELNKTNNVFTKLGFIQGAGNLTRLNKDQWKGLEINIGKDDEDVKTLFGSHINGRNFYTTEFTDILTSLQFCDKILPERTLPETFNEWELNDKKQFMKGLYSANGCVIESAKRIAFKSTSKELIKQISEFLGSIGIDTYITTNKSKKVKFSNGEYQCKESYDINICRHYSIIKFAKEIGFIHNYKNEKLINIIKNTSPIVTSIKPNGLKEVFDFNLDSDNHWGIVEGVVAHNCGEIPLSQWESCCLGHLVLPRFINNKNVNWELLGKTIRTAVRFLDNILSVNKYPLDCMKITASKLRRIGLGTTGLADMLVLCGLKYGSEESLRFINKLERFISKQAYEASILLAVEKGAFERCNPELHIKSGFVKRMTPKIKELILEHGIRNCAMLTKAPVGTTSILSGNCSSGIEPIFAPAYERRYFDGEERKTELVFHPLFKKYMDENKDVNHFAGIKELDVEDHFKVQEVIQTHVDNAVSKTINIPTDYPVERMSELWLKYLPALKGTTFYRENSREEPPLKALSLEEAKKLYNKDVKIGSEEHQCKGGTCEL